MLLHRVLGEFFLALLWITVVTGFGGVDVRVVTLRPGEIARRVGG